jgi:hypothetical protein
MSMVTARSFARAKMSLSAHRCSLGLQLHIARGNERIDIQCPADQNLESCVNAAS